MKYVLLALLSVLASCSKEVEETPVAPTPQPWFEDAAKEWGVDFTYQKKAMLEKGGGFFYQKKPMLEKVFVCYRYDARVVNSSSLASFLSGLSTHLPTVASTPPRASA